MLVGGIPDPLKVWVRQLGRISFFPTEWKVIKAMFQTTQPVYIYNYRWFSQLETSIYFRDFPWRTVRHNQVVYPIKSHKKSLNRHFPMVFPNAPTRAVPMARPIPSPSMPSRHKQTISAKMAHSWRRLPDGRAPTVQVQPKWIQRLDLTRSFSAKMVS